MSLICVSSGESPICKGVVGALFWADSLKRFLDGLTKGISHLFLTDSLITLSSYSWVKSIGLPVIGSSFVYMDPKEKLDMESLDMDPTIFQNPENLLNPDWISNYVR